MAAKKRAAPPQPKETSSYAEATEDKPTPAIVIRPITHLTIRQWQSNPELQRKLRALIDDPVFLLAHNTLINAAFPGWEPASKAEAGVSAEALNSAVALRYAHRSGMGYYPRMLRVLTADKAAQLPHNPYGELLPEDE